MPREALLARTLVELADSLVDDFDVVELLTLLTDRCVEVLDVDAAGLMLVAPEGDLRVVASSSEEMRLVELFELQSQEGPCPDCYRTGEVIAERTGLDMEGAFSWLRHHARNHNLLLVDVAQSVIDGSVTPDPPPPTHRS